MINKSISCFFFVVVSILLAYTCIFASSTAEPLPEFLTKEERQWLAEHPVVRVGVGVAFPPYQWVEKNKEEHLFKGVVSEYLHILEQRLNVKMQIVFGIPFSQALDLGRKNQIDFFPCLASTAERSEFLLFTAPYISYPSVIITRQDAPFVGGLQDLSGRTISTVKDQIIHTKLLTGYGHLNLRILESESSAKDLETVSLGGADATIIDLGVASYLTQKLRLTNLKVMAPSELDRIELAMGVRKDWPVFQGILEKTLARITVEERNIINQKWIQFKYEPGVSRERILRWSGAGALGIGTVLAIFLYWNRSLKKELSERKKIEKERNDLIDKLKQALTEVKTLRGCLPICASCKNIRSDSGYWEKIENYIQEHSEAHFSHCICPDCLRELYPDMAEEILQSTANSAVGINPAHLNVK